MSYCGKRRMEWYKLLIQNHVMLRVMKIEIILMFTVLFSLVISSDRPMNVLDTELQPCCTDPLTGYYRDGYCRTGRTDLGVHTVCAIMTEEFLSFTSSCGNDLVTPMPQYNFPGLKPGDKWCLCASRWKEAMEKGFAPSVVLESTHERTLEIVDLETLRRYAVQRI